MKRYLVLINALLFALPAVSRAQYATPTEGFNKNGTRAAQFLKIGIGARANAMGSAYSAAATDASALYWNAGGVGMLTQSEIYVSHVEFLLDVQMNFVGVVLPMSGFGNLGLSITSLSMDSEPVTALGDPDGLSGEVWDASGLAVGVTMSRSLTDRFAAGVTAKYIRERLYHSPATTVAFDIGGVYKTSVRGLTLGLAMTNFGGKMKLSGLGSGEIDVEPDLGGNITQTGTLEARSWHLPLLFRFGIALDILKTEGSALLAVADFNHPTDADERLNFGAEYSFQNRVFLRGGYKIGYDEESVTAGGGVVVPFGVSALQLDYAYSSFGLLGQVHRFSLDLRM